MTSETLKERRKALSLTQQQLADALGIHQVTVARWENGTRDIPPYLDLTLDGLALRLTAPSLSHPPAPAAL